MGGYITRHSAGTNESTPPLTVNRSDTIFLDDKDMFSSRKRGDQRVSKGMRLLAPAIGVFTLIGSAQEPILKPSFESVSVHVSDGKPMALPKGAIIYSASDGTLMALPMAGTGRGFMQGGPGSPDPDQFAAHGITVKGLVQRAYSIRLDRIVGPDWTDRSLFDVTARVPPGATEEQFDLMLQSLLADRFKLEVHRENEESPAYELVVAPGGVKLKEKVTLGSCALGPGTAPVGSDHPETALPAPGIAKNSSGGTGFLCTQPPKSGIGSKVAIASGSGVQLSALAHLLQDIFGGAPVVDKTRLDDNYDFSFAFVQPTLANPADSPDLDIFTAVEELGLKLNESKTYVNVLLIDNGEQPIDN